MSNQSLSRTKGVVQGGLQDQWNQPQWMPASYPTLGCNPPAPDRRPPTTASWRQQPVLFLPSKTGCSRPSTSHGLQLRGGSLPPACTELTAARVRGDIDLSSLTPYRASDQHHLRPAVKHHSPSLASLPHARPENFRSSLSRFPNSKRLPFWLCRSRNDAPLGQSTSSRFVLIGEVRADNTRSTPMVPRIKPVFENAEPRSCPERRFPRSSSGCFRKSNRYGGKSLPESPKWREEQMGCACRKLSR